MSSTNKIFYYYLILFATLLVSISFIPIIYNILSTSTMTNIPYSSLILMIIAFLIFLYYSIEKKYYIHIGLYLLGFLSIAFIIFLKFNEAKNTNKNDDDNEYDS
jgi:uncharacterized protein with PQ loop repeat